MSISSVIKSLQDIMRKDAGVDGDAQRLGQLSWLLFLKIFDTGDVKHAAAALQHRACCRMRKIE